MTIDNLQKINGREDMTREDKAKLQTEFSDRYVRAHLVDVFVHETNKVTTWYHPEVDLSTVFSYFTGGTFAEGVSLFDALRNIRLVDRYETEVNKRNQADVGYRKDSDGNWKEYDRQHGDDVDELQTSMVSRSGPMLSVSNASTMERELRTFRCGDGEGNVCKFYDTQISTLMEKKKIEGNTDGTKSGIVITGASTVDAKNVNTSSRQDLPQREPGYVDLRPQVGKDGDASDSIPLTASEKRGDENETTKHGGDKDNSAKVTIDGFVFSNQVEYSDVSIANYGMNQKTTFVVSSTQQSFSAEANSAPPDSLSPRARVSELMTRIREWNAQNRLIGIRRWANHLSSTIAEKMDVSSGLFFYLHRGVT